VKARRIVLAAALAVLLPLTTAADCKKGESPGHGDAAKPPAGAVPTPAAAPKDWPVNGRKFYGAAITVWVEEGYTPFYVTIDVTDTTTGEHINVISTHDELGLKVDRQYWTVPLAYPGGHRVHIVVHVKAAKPGQGKGYITVREGSRPYASSAGFNGTASAALDYTTQRA
jgi:hypothetical protein